jgi:hypothetical protein
MSTLIEQGLQIVGIKSGKWTVNVLPGLNRLACRPEDRRRGLQMSGRIAHVGGTLACRVCRSSENSGAYHMDGTISNEVIFSTVIFPLHTHDHLPRCKSSQPLSKCSYTRLRRTPDMPHWSHLVSRIRNLLTYPRPFHSIISPPSCRVPYECKNSSLASLASRRLHNGSSASRNLETLAP